MKKLLPLAMLSVFLFSIREWLAVFSALQNVYEKDPLRGIAAAEWLLEYGAEPDVKFPVGQNIMKMALVEMEARPTMAKLFNSAYKALKEDDKNAYVGMHFTE